MKYRKIMKDKNEKEKNGPETEEIFGELNKGRQ